MPLFGIDTSHYQAGMNYRQVAAEGLTFVVGKVSEGAGFRDPQWVATRDQAREAGLLVAGYHYITEEPAAAQAANCAAALGDFTIPVALDWERHSGGWSQFVAVQQAFARAGVHVWGAYVPLWYWLEQGSPDMTGAGLPLWASRYRSTLPSTPAQLYDNVRGIDWAGYGGLAVQMLQFANIAQVAGMTVDCDAFLGTRDKLAVLFGLPQPPRPGPSSLPALEYGMLNNAHVANLQRFLNAYPWRPELRLLPVTGNYLDSTRAVLRAAQAQMGITGPDADGSRCGLRTNTALWNRGYRG
jgi:lysozyme